MVGSAEKVESNNEMAREGEYRHPLAEMPDFDPEVAARQVEEARNRINNEGRNEVNFGQDSENLPGRNTTSDFGVGSRIAFDESLEDMLGDDGDGEYNSYDATNISDDLERSNRPRKELDKLLANPEALKKIGHNYLNQYQPNSQSIAAVLYKKDLIDHYVAGRLAGGNAQNFVNSDEFRNYAKYILNVMAQKSQQIGNREFYPELVTNPVLKDPKYRELVLRGSRAWPAEKFTQMNKVLEESKKEYLATLQKVGERMDRGELVSQDELDAAGDYLYISRDYGNGLAKKFACYLFNEAGQQNLSCSTPVAGAIANYFAYKDTLDDRLKNSRIIFANNCRYDPNTHEMRKVSTGVSMGKFCVLEQNRVPDISLSSDEGLDKSRPESFTDLYSLMLVAFHELTHDYQKLMRDDGKESSSAMCSILNVVLRQDRRICYQATNHDMSPKVDENGNLVRTGYYNANHDSDEMEIQADEEAWRQCRKFLIEHERDYSRARHDSGGEARTSEHWGRCMDNEREVNARRAFALKIDADDQVMPYVQYDIKHLGQSIKKDPELFKRFPQLAHYFEESGLIRPEVFFEKNVGDTKMELNNMDALVDNFGVEVATYALMSPSNANHILEYIQNPGNDLNIKQVEQCVRNLYNALQQDVLKMRVIKRVDFSHYDATATRGKDTEIGDLQKTYLEQFMIKLSSYARIAEALEQRFPQITDNIEGRDERSVNYYKELALGIELEDDFSRRAKNIYSKSGIGVLKEIAQLL